MVARAKSPSKSAKAVDRQLERYRSMRDFDITAEPRGSSNGSRAQSEKALPFVVQKHAARQLHYDFRLGLHGVLKSWAVAKGPSYYTGDKRLAVQVEDHPMEYGGFEGTIPKGQYGGGTVMVWDFGDWSPIGDPDRGLEEGNLKFVLNGKKLKGKWALIRMKRNLDRSDRPNWLLIKEKDEFAQPEDAPAVVDLAPDSAITGRTMEEIAKSDDHVWDSKRGLLERRDSSDESHSKPTATPARTSKKPSASNKKLLASAPPERFPGFITPQLAQQAASAPNGDEWVHEIKLDGYRIQIHIRTRERSNQRIVTLLTRKGLNWTARMPDIARAAAKLGVQDAILDGEVVVLDEQGRTSFAELQAAFQEGKQRYLTYFAFDLLHLDGHNVRELPLLDRKSLLRDLFSRIEEESALRFSEHIYAKGEEVFAQACKLGAEGIVSKVASDKYLSGRSNEWLKIKCIQEQEFVIGGFTPPAKGGQGIGALLLGYYEDGNLRYAGRSGTGFTHQTHRILRSRLDPLMQKMPSFAAVPREAQKDARWVKPELVAQIAFSNWTNDGLVRQAAFKGLREDKPPKEVVREMPIPREQSAPSQSGRQRIAARANPIGKGRSSSALPITHPNKILDPESGITKQQLAEYYLAVGGHMLPHIADRPLSLVRCPEGTSKPCFFQKHIGLGLPEGIGSVEIPNRKTHKKEKFVTLSTEQGLIGLAQMGVLEVHPWGSKNDALETPDRIIFDLDPDVTIQWTTLASTARELRDRLKQLKLASFVKSTGGKGLHVVIPIVPRHEWPVIKRFAHSVVLTMEREKPGLYITKMTKAERTNRIYLDYLRNDRESTAVAPFSPRARSGVPAAVPLDWKELDGRNRPLFHVSDFAQWNDRLKHDPWKAMTKLEQPLTEETLRFMDQGRLVDQGQRVRRKPKS
jgi:bifunctional non-homologous end joining protein LigD